MVSFLAISISIASHAQEGAKKLPRKKIPIDSDRMIVLTYGNPAWNTSSTTIETSTVIMRDSSTGKIVQITLDETQPDSSSFSGTFAVTWTSAQQINPEVYIPPQELTQNQKGLEKLQEMILKGELPRKPFLIKKGDRGENIFDVYDTKDQVENALALYKKSKEPTVSVPVAAIAEKSAAAAVLEAEQIAAIEVEKQKLASEAVKREQERLRFEQIERQKADELKRKQAEMDAALREKRKKEAIEFAKLGMEFFRSGNFEEAEKNFVQSIERDPSNVNYYYSYGVSLYKNGKFNQSLVILNMAKGEGFDPIEKDFYIALNHYRLKEYKVAMEEFGAIKKTKHKAMAPSSAFYMGIIDFDQARYEQAKPNFQETLDTSSDPRLDEKAEEYIEKIDRILMFAKNKAKQFLFSAKLGTVYDSNVLLTANSTADQASPSSIGGPRAIVGGSIHWRPIYEKAHEFGLKLNTDYYYTFTSSLAQADPFLNNLNAPYVYKGMLWGKGYKLELKPAYEILNLDANNDGTKERYMDSIVFDCSNTLVMNENWYSSYNLKSRKDTVSSSTGLNAVKVTLNFNNIFFFNKKKTVGVVADGGLTSNNAEGRDNKFSRFDIGGTYLTPGPWETQATAGLAFFQANYSESSTGRADSNFTLATSMSKSLYDWLSGNINASYVINNSNQSANAYKKYTIGIQFAADYSL